jgi:hypothetical protein
VRRYNRHRAPSRFPIVSGDKRAGNGFHNQCEHWWRKQFLRSASRPEIPQDFRLAKKSLCGEKLQGGFSPPQRKAARQISVAIEFAFVLMYTIFVK